MTDREKIIELLNKAHDGFYCANFDPKRSYMGWMADFLIANGCRLERKQATSDTNTVETNIYHQEEIHHNCTVQILHNSVTGEQSVGWWEEKEQQWISVKDRLPEDGEPVLVYKERHSEAYGNMSTAYYRRGRWFGSIGEVITHWMPLPDAPED
jgi:hypothetical protein